MGQGLHVFNDAVSRMDKGSQEFPLEVANPSTSLKWNAEAVLEAWSLSSFPRSSRTWLQRTLIQDQKELTFEILLQLEHALYTREKRKGEGIAYTPLAIATLLVEQALSAMKSSGYEQTKSIRILDPACGTGIFLFALCNHFLQSSPFASSSHIENFIAQSLFALERDPVALEISKILVTSFLMSQRSQLSSKALFSICDKNFRHGNFLLALTMPAALGSLTRSIFITAAGRVRLIS